MIRKNLFEESSNNTTENEVVEVLFRGNDGNKYQCAGVLMRDTDDGIRVAFNAIAGVVKDYLDIPKEDVIESVVVKPEEIQHL